MGPLLVFYSQVSEMVRSKTNDASFFTLVHEVLEAEDKLAVERRGSPRHEYPVSQLIAPYNGRTLPVSSAFRQVQCHDLSPHGFSYISGVRPEHDFLVVALGQVPFTFLVARVVHTAERPDSDGTESLVGCEFTQRITP